MARSSSMVAASSVALTAAVVATTVFLLRRKRDAVVTDEEEDASTKHVTTRTVSSLTTSLPEPPNHEPWMAAAAADSLEPQPKNAVAAVVAPYEEEEKKEMDPSPPKQRLLSRGTVTIAYASTMGTCAGFAQTLYDRLQKETQQDAASQKLVIQMGQVQDFDWWDEILNVEEETKENTDTATTNNEEDALLPAGVILFVLPTFSHGTLPPVAQAALLDALTEITHDWRVAARPLKQKAIRVAAFGMGSSAYSQETFCKPARDVIHLLCARMGAERLYRGAIGTGDDEVGDASQSFDHWITHQILPSLFPTPPKKNTTSSCQDNSCACASSTTDSSHDHKNDSTHEGGCCQKNDTNAEPIEEEEEEEDYSDDDEEEDNEEPIILDLEDMGPSMMAATNASQSKEPKEMVTPKQAKALKKEGYKLIGTHSAVKLCRWTKHQLRGRGGCYKHTFYGITSYQCMEATPSLACANKCVFCWRHHKNPVAKEWKWKTDDPYYIVDEAVKMHVSMIKETKGIPGVQKERWEEAHTVRHCALSLVGEPIMYPRIDELLGDLHSRSISTFLVTNGQHPDAIAALRPITQLYVSVDAPTPESLDAIDRPLFKDAWMRLRRSLVSLKDKGQRTVARLTVVKGWNSDEIGGYAELIALGKVSLVEVKGVTFCGKSDASNLNMSNSPWHHEVVSLTQALQQELAKLTEKGGPNAPPLYGVACEHRHSCSVVLARIDQFSETNPDTGELKWKTWIDYDKFHKLASRNAADPTFTFQVEDYTADTPSWALFGAEEEGFDPTDKRHRKKKKHPKYTKYDANGIPTHDDNNEPLAPEEMERLTALMVDKKKEIGNGSSVKEVNGGEKTVADASLMFRGLVVTK